MLQALFTAPSEVTLETVPTPTPRANEALIQVDACGVCGTDRSIFGGLYPVEFPIVLGHEYAGTVVEVGSDVKNLAVGQRVAVDPNVTCQVCAYCRRGLTHLCGNLSPLGIVRQGGYAEYSAVPEQNAYVLPDSVSLEEGALLEPLACCVRGMQLSNLELGDRVVILGAGPIGCLLTQLFRTAGASQIIVSDFNRSRRKLALAFGADVVVDSVGEFVQTEVKFRTQGLGADVAVDASGTEAGAAMSLSLTRRGGTVLWFGSAPPQARVSVSPFWVNDNEITIRGSFNNPFTHAPALALVAGGRVDVRSLITDRVALPNILRALDLKNFPNAGKIVVRPNGAPD
jgi:L-iditol 2-dehydrogenase